MKLETKIMAFVLFIEGILGLVSTFTETDFSFVLGDYGTIFSTYPILGILAFLVTTIMFLLVTLSEHKIGYGMLIALLIFGLYAIPLGAIISIVFLLWILAEYNKFEAECL